MCETGRDRAFTMVELLTVVGIVGVLATLAASAFATSKMRGQQAVCASNLQQVSLAVSMYADDTGKRPRSVTRLTGRSSWLGNSNVLICPGDPSLFRRAEASHESGAWGNLACPSQEPPYSDDMGEPESGSWQNDLAERQETVLFSYLHPLGWPKKAWQTLMSHGNQAGDAVCQLHGVRVPPGPNSGERPLYMAYEGRTLRAQRDGSVVTRKIFFDPGASPGSASNAPRQRQTYPWEFYIDNPSARQ
jgi:prepilin-type N-terminal cleavage/methylation domain-containing protein